MVNLSSIIDFKTINGNPSLVFDGDVNELLIACANVIARVSCVPGNTIEGSLEQVNEIAKEIHKKIAESEGKAQCEKQENSVSETKQTE